MLVQGIIGIKICKPSLVTVQSVQSVNDAALPTDAPTSSWVMFCINRSAFDIVRICHDVLE